MTFESFTHGERHGIVDFIVPSLFINVGALPPDPVRPWHPAQPFRTYRSAPSLAVPCPGGSSFPVGLMEMSQVRVSSAVGALPTPYVGDCAHPMRPSATTIASRPSR